MRYVLDITYKGTHYSGWQIQPNAPSIQEEIDRALTTFLRQKTACTGAGRTDAGVHASQMIAHFDYEHALPESFLHGMNGILPADIAINAVYEAKKDDFHARFHALSRSYTYQIVSRKSPLFLEQAMWVRHPLDVSRMQEAADMMKKYEEFGSFCKAHADNLTNLCQIYEARWEQTDQLLLFHIKANRFLRGMVRAVVGTLLDLGRGKYDLLEFQKILDAQDRRAAGASAPAQGLFLTQVSYPEESWS